MITRRVWDKSWCCEGQGQLSLAAGLSDGSETEHWTNRIFLWLITEQDWVARWDTGVVGGSRLTMTRSLLQCEISRTTPKMFLDPWYLCGEKFSVAVTHWLMLVITYVCHHKGQVITPSPLSGPVQESLSWLRNLSHFIWYKLSPNVTEKMWLRDAVVVKKCIKILPNALQWLSKLFRKLVNCLLLGTCIIWLIQLLNGCAIPLL